jgi:LysM repeat protein
MLIGQNICAQPTNSEEVDDSTYVELIEVAPRKTLVIPPFQLINPDTLKLGEHDELVCDSYTALGMPYVYDALHSFNARRMDKFGGYLNVKINQGLESIRKKGFNSDVKQLYIQVNPKTLTVHWVAVVGPSEDGKCYVRVDSRGSAGGGLPAVNKQLPRMHNLYPTLTAVKLLEFNENVIKCYDWNGNPLDSVCSFVNIRQHFFKYYDNQVGNTITLEDYVAKYPYTTDGEQLPGTKKFVAPTYRTYKVKSGDSLSTIAAKYHTTVSKIKKANGLRSDLIRIGQVLKIPT